MTTESCLSTNKCISYKERKKIQGCVKHLHKMKNISFECLIINTNLLNLTILIDTFDSIIEILAHRHFVLFILIYIRKENITSYWGQLLRKPAVGL